MRRLLATVAPLVLLIGTAATHAQSRDMTKSLQDFCHSFDTTSKEDAILIPPKGPS